MTVVCLLQRLYISIIVIGNVKVMQLIVMSLLFSDLICVIPHLILRSAQNVKLKLCLFFVFFFYVKLLLLIIFQSNFGRVSHESIYSESDARQKSPVADVYLLRNHHLKRRVPFVQKELEMLFFSQKLCKLFLVIVFSSHLISIFQCW